MTPKRVILHCSATPDKGDFIGAKQIDDWHRERGFNGIGYHWVIRRSGVIEPGRSETKIGAHTRSQNYDSIGICLIGTRDFTKKQIQALRELSKDIKIRWAIDHNNWFCHYEFTSKDCPNIPVEVVRQLVKQSF